MLVFHAKRSGGDRRLLAQVYGLKPPSAFVLTFKIVKEAREFGTVIKTSLPKSARKWAYVTHFDMKLQRTYTYQGEAAQLRQCRLRGAERVPGRRLPVRPGELRLRRRRRTTVTATHVADSAHCTVR